MDWKNYPVYFEAGDKKVFACALDWPGWCRSGKDEAAALQVLLDYGPRYASAIRSAREEFIPPTELSQLKVAGRLAGTKATDFGVPDMMPARDGGPLDEGSLKRLQSILVACWQALGETIRANRGRELRKGPRGGGRDLVGIARHVIDAEKSYLTRLGTKSRIAGDTLQAEIEAAQQAVREGLEMAWRGELPSQGPRGGKIWPARYYVRRSAWHILDHVWEIEDKLI